MSDYHVLAHTWVVGICCSGGGVCCGLAMIWTVVVFMDFNISLLYQ